MINTQKLLQLVRWNKITLCFADLGEGVYGYYTCKGKNGIILINRRITGDIRLLRTTLAEELGHAFTSEGDLTPLLKNQVSSDSADEMYKLYYETLAHQWATDFLIPTGLLFYLFIHNPGVSVKEISDVFLVTEDFVFEKLYLLSIKNLDWDMNRLRFLHGNKFGFGSKHDTEEVKLNYLNYIGDI